MAARQSYNLPDYKTVTNDLDTYIGAWRSMAKPIEEALGLELSAYDPTFVFVKGNPQTAAVTTVNLPVWFVRDLSQALSKNEHTVAL